MTPFNLPPGVSLRDIDPPACHECEGSGEIETCGYDILRTRPFTKWVTCPSCSGLGVPNRRTKGQNEH